LTTGQRHEPGIGLIGQAKLSEQRFRIEMTMIERGPEVDGLPDFDAFLKLGRLQLNTNAILQRVDVAEGIETDHGNGTGVRLPQPFDTLHGRRLPGAIWSDESEDLAGVDVERHVVDGNDRSVGFADARDVDDWLGHSSQHRLS
jgi:hypothetical protein